MTKIASYSVVALGKFDGVHLGHRVIIDKTVKIAKDMGLKSSAYIIDISNDLTNRNEKKELLEELGVDEVVFQDFSLSFKNLTPEEFFSSILIDKLNVKHIVVGTDYRFGRDRMGDVNLISSLCEKNNIEISVLEKLKIDGDIVSSTLIKEMILEGSLLKANKLLGRNYNLTSVAQKGKQLGKKMGFPTVNFTHIDKLIPHSGVYFTKTHYNSNVYNSITNVGVNPTIDTDNKTKIETYIFDFNKDVYGDNIKIEFLEKLRDEIKFESAKELINQIETDKNKAIKYFKKY